MEKLGAGICMPILNIGYNGSAFAVLKFYTWDFHTRELSPLHWAAFFSESMIEIVCDNRHSNWTAHNDKRAKNRLNAIYKSEKWQGLQ